MTQFAVTKHVVAAPDRVWAIVTDVAHYDRVIQGITAVEQLDDLPDFGVGTTWRETRKMFGQEASEKMDVTAVDPGTSYTVNAASHGAVYTSVISLTPNGTGTDLTMTFGAEPTSSVAAILAKTVGRVFEGATKKALKQDLNDIARAAEAS
ncbi:MAG: SRPBCC family protein [Actinomycetia bacterium]|nr:SRPBCC family protein [Actinomycetes bacterium]